MEMVVEDSEEAYVDDSQEQASVDSTESEDIVVVHNKGDVEEYCNPALARQGSFLYLHQSYGICLLHLSCNQLVASVYGHYRSVKCLVLLQLLLRL